ncbi:MAG: ABC-2 family transporter protein [Thermomicrobiales bacterium]
MEATPELRKFTFRDLARFYAGRFRIDLNLQIQYRGAIAIWLMGLILQPLVALVVWTTVAQNQGGNVSGFTTSEYAAYFIILMIVDNLTFTWVMYEFEYRIQTGQFSALLLRPVHPIHQDVTTNMSFKTLGLFGVIPAAIILSFAFSANYNASLLDIVVFLPALILAMALRFIFEWTLGLLAFWITRTSAVFQLYNSISFFLAGNIAPLWLFPESVQMLTFVLPFRWTVFFPVEVLLGRATVTSMLVGFGMQLLWLGIACVGLRYLWKLASSRYSAVGG